jgi:hypothetical protein
MLTTSSAALRLRALLDDLLARRLAKPDLVIVDGGKGPRRRSPACGTIMLVQRWSVGLLNKQVGCRQVWVSPG